MTSSVIIHPENQRWQGLPVISLHGHLQKIAETIPRFERRTFGPAFLPVNDDEGGLFSNRQRAGMNSFYDTIVRMPMTPQEHEVPVGIVSPNYHLLQHHDLFEELLRALKKLQIDPFAVKASVSLTTHGERMRLSVLFPQTFNLKVKDNDEMGLRLECFNSVDGSMKFMSVIGWLRFVCSNGLVVGVADTYYRKRHNRDMKLDEIAAVMREGIASTTMERQTYQEWSRTKVEEGRFKEWVNGPLAKRWGVKAAARTWHITLTGQDVSFADPFEKGKATEKTVVPGNKVPGAVLPGDNFYAIVQSMSWLAKERRDVMAQLEWKREIPELVAILH